MLKQQLSPRSVHPYQTTVVPRSEKQFTSANQRRAEYPWAEENTPVYQLTGIESSNSENPYHVPHYYQSFQRDCGPPSPVYQMPYATGKWQNHKKNDRTNLPTKPVLSNTYSFPPCVSAFSLPLCDIGQSRAASHSSAPPPPPLSPEVPIIGACGGNCPGFEYVCYYILQVIFVVGILTGISLCIAGIVLRQTSRNGDLGVLVYIGCLSSCVCGVLLGVQCCVRREIRQRKLRANLHMPMQSIQEPPATACPLLPRSQVYVPTTTNVCHEEEEITGVPWWRRTNRD